MKEGLYRISALVALGMLATTPAPAAGLEASLAGFMKQWFGFSDQDEDTTAGPAGGVDFTETNFTSDTEVHFNAAGTLDNGLKVRYHVELEGNTDSDQIDESYLTVTGGFGQIILGSTNSAGHNMAFVPKEFGIEANSGDTTFWVNGDGQGNGGVRRKRTPWASGWVEADASCDDDKRLTYYTPRFSGFQFGASYAANCGSQDTNALGTDATIEHAVSFGANYKRKIQQFDLGLSAGYNHGEKPAGNTGDDPAVIVFGARFGYAGFTLGGYYADALGAIDQTPTSGLNAGMLSSNDNQGFGVGLAYETDAWGISLTWITGARSGTH